MPTPRAAANVLARADAIDLLRHVPAATATLAYLDPPFLVGVSHGARTKSRESRGRSSTIAYVDKWPSIDAYVAWLEPRLAVVRDALSSRGTMWLHLDHRAVHEAKVASDRVFGPASFLGEIIWAPGNGSKARRGPGVTHQTLLVYSKGDDYVWNARDASLREPYAATSRAMHFRSRDADGRAYRERTIAKTTYRYYADEGRALGSVWTDCPAMVANTPLRKETTGYPTQKPLKLLDRIVRASSSAGDLVVDPCCGSGTTLVAAAMAGRAFAGSDLGELAIATATKRLREIGAAFQVR
jgi:site-specific DNA-methyltransferase (adenine-specific)